MEVTIRYDAEIIWGYMHMQQPPTSAQVLLVLGSRDDRVALYAAQLLTRYEYDIVVVSGGQAGHNPMLRGAWLEATEAEHFVNVMRRAGYNGHILMEKTALSTGQNAQLSYKLLQKEQVTPVSSIQLLTKPYMERRALATFEVQWPEQTTTLRVSSPDLSFDDYCDSVDSMETMIHVMVGDLQRIMEYPARGWQTEQDIPDVVTAAYERLLAAGFTDRMLH